MLNVLANLRKETIKAQPSKIIASQLNCVRLTGEMTTKEKPLVELFIKAAPTDKREKGPCLIDQQWFMAMYCLVEQGLIDLRLTPMSLEMAPPNYLRLNVARHLPVAWIESGFVQGKDYSGVIISSTEHLEQLMEKLGSPNLNPYVNPDDALRAEEVFEDLYRNLMNYIRYDNLRPLMSTLTALDSYLAQRAQPYLLDDYPVYVDCQLMPKLQHLRVAARAYKNFDIPEHLTHLWAYIDRMYHTKAFICSCPSDRDILAHYNEKDKLPHSIRISLLGSECLSDVPETVLNNQPMVNGE
ncbi:Chloride intracellular channel exc-4 [Paragonimus heterotremus]|uniref:Chloride intracellular channel exc-4 n=1 Tax=Paragonimus heterotremus TaxID=100268 RepID=A0A8J4SSX9_9TREM|nr:Chloride intracellular channel exc-4 [Paragonimus heterotremus]